MKIKKYRKKPVVVEAMQFNSRDDIDSLMAWGGSNIFIGKYNGHVMVKTLEGDIYVSIGDYVIKGVKGEFYPIKADIFELTYEGEFE